MIKLKVVEEEVEILTGLVENSAMKALQSSDGIKDQGFSDLCQKLAAIKMELELVDAVKRRLFGDKV